jgi:copper oxidase (laccase) domain-containing protein
MNILDYVKIETSTVDDGNMSYSYGKKLYVTQNRERFFRKNGFNYDSTYLFTTNFERLNHVKILNSKPNSFTVIPDIDSLITTNKDIVLALLTADCLQITLYDIKNNVLAMIHAGLKWQNAGIIDKTFEILQKTYGTKADNLLVHLGNCISREHYRWDSNIFNYININSWIGKTIEEDTHLYRPYKIDIRRAAILNLKDIGILEKNIIDSNIDCYSNKKYFSHVRSVYSNEKDGRHMTLVQMK